MRSDLTELVIVLDRSGSMHLIKRDMEGAVNELIGAQIKEPGELRVTLYQFNGGVTKKYESLNALNVPPLVIEPSGSTALRDGLSFAIDDTGERFSRTPEDQRPSKVLFAVITDGEDNVPTQRNTLQQVRDRVTHQTDAYKWVFTYLGANVDAFAVGAQLGIAAGNTLNYNCNRGSLEATSQSLHSNLSAYRNKGNFPFYTEQQRTAVAVK